LLACGDDSGGGGAGTGAGTGSPSGSGATSGGGAGMGGMMADDPINADCQNKQGPFDGAYGQKGKCCYRTSNSSRLPAMTSGMATLEYRLTYFVPSNHPLTLSSDLISGTTADRFDKEEQHLLFRFKVPYMDGKFTAGMGTAQIGAGAYDCMGKYSFYSDTAAPETPVFKNAARWSTTEVPIMFDPTKTTWEQQAHTIWASNINRKVTNLPYIQSMGDKPLEWEAASQGFDIVKMPKIEDAINCVGTRVDAERWMGGGQTVSYQRLNINNKSAIQVLLNISLAQLQAFGMSIGPMKDDPKYDVLTAKRCMPGSAGCQWLKLPDSMCPETDEEMGMWGCHIADPANVDKVPVKCSMEKPTAVLDPDKGATTEGQCCDPLGEMKDGLPACNSYRLISDFVAAAADITDAPTTKVQQKCN
jgi:hypothetical protein